MEMKIEPLALPGVDTQRPIVIAGPCSAETEEHHAESQRCCQIQKRHILQDRKKPVHSIEA